MRESDVMSLLRTTVSEAWIPPQAHQLWGLAVYPIYRRPSWNPAPLSRLRYTPLREALASEQARIGELPEAHVPEVLVTNQGQVIVLGLDGDELVGGKQNRILNASVLLDRGDTRLPVSCVERGRWAHNSDHFRGGERLPHGLRRTSAGHVYNNVSSHASYHSDQRAIWHDIEGYGVRSQTSAMHEFYQTRKAELQAYVDALPYPDHALGMVVALGGKVVSLDLFDQPATCQHYWPVLIKACAAEALDELHYRPQGPGNLLNHIRECHLEVFQSPGLGKDVRLHGKEVEGSALLHEHVVVHLNLFTKEAQ